MKQITKRLNLTQRGASAAAASAVLNCNTRRNLDGDRPVAGARVMAAEGKGRPGVGKSAGSCRPHLAPSPPAHGPRFRPVQHPWTGTYILE